MERNRHRSTETEREPNIVHYCILQLLEIDACMQYVGMTFISLPVHNECTEVQNPRCVVTP